MLHWCMINRKPIDLDCRDCWHFAAWGIAINNSGPPSRSPSESLNSEIWPGYLIIPCARNRSNYARKIPTHARGRPDRRVASGPGLRRRSAAGAGAKQRRLLQLGAARAGTAGETGCLAPTLPAASGARPHHANLLRWCYLGFQAADCSRRAPPQRAFGCLPAGGPRPAPMPA